MVLHGATGEHSERVRVLFTPPPFQWLCEAFNQASLSGRIKTAMDVLVVVCERADKFLETQALSSSGEGGSGGTMGFHLCVM